MSHFGQTPLRNSTTMATAKVPDDQKLFEIVCYTLVQKGTKFQPPFRAVFKQPPGQFPPYQNRANSNDIFGLDTIIGSIN